MSLLERTRHTSDAPSHHAQGGWPLRLRAATAGVSAAVLSLLTVCLPALLVWVASPQSTVPWTTAFAIGADGWLLAQGVHLQADAASVSVIPLLLTALTVTMGSMAVRRVLAGLDDHHPRRLRGWGALRRDVAEVAVSFTAAYAVTGLVVSLTARGPHVRPSVVGAVVGTAVAAALAVVLGTLVEFRGHRASLAPELADRIPLVLPAFVRRGFGPAWSGALLAFGVGLALVVGEAVVHAQRIGVLYGALTPGVVGGSVLSLGQLMVLPNFALWGLAWMAGPGFGVAEGSSITWTHSNPGLLPLVPAFGALPDPGPLPSVLRFAVAVPVLVGAFVAWRCIRKVTRLATWQTKAKVTATACTLCALGLAVAVGLSGGALGSRELANVGADAVLVGACLLGELVAGAAVVVALSQWRATGWRFRG
jgi:hypothetical protein